MTAAVELLPLPLLRDLNLCPSFYMWQRDLHGDTGLVLDYEFGDKMSYKMLVILKELIHYQRKSS